MHVVDSDDFFGNCLQVKLDSWLENSADFLKKFILPLISTISCIAIFARGESFAASEPRIRVLVSQGKELHFRAHKSSSLIVKGINSTGKSIKFFKVNLANGQLRYSTNKDFSKWRYLPQNRQIRITTRDPRGVWLGKRRFGGELRLLEKTNTIQVINYLKIEKYLKSVVGSEMPKNWPIEALKAQAVAARTYALHQLKKRTDYDVNSSVSSQVYLGLESETNKTVQAVDSTRSIVMLYKGDLIDAVFHSSSGGQTESSVEVWGKYRAYLISVLGYDQSSPFYKWEKKIEHKKLDEIFKTIGGFNTMRIIQKTKTNRASIVKVYGPKGVKFISGKELRSLLNLKSTLFNLKVIPYDLNRNIGKSRLYNYGENINAADKNFLVQLNPENIFIDEPPPIKDNNFLLIKGSGAGHGVGLSQWGAKDMADRGASYRNILMHFYRGVKISPFKKVKTF